MIAGSKTTRRRAFLQESGRFLVVGAVGTVTTIGLFNLLVYAGGTGPMNRHPLPAFWLAYMAGVALTYLGNRYWTYRDRVVSGSIRSYLVFLLLNLVSLGIPSVCLAFSRYVLGLSGPGPDNVSANMVGLVLSTMFRFWAYRVWVFRPPRLRDHAEVEAIDDDLRT